MFERRRTLLLKGDLGLASITLQTSIKLFFLVLRVKLSQGLEQHYRQRVTFWDCRNRGFVLGMGFTIGVTQSPSARIQPLHNYPKSLQSSAVAEVHCEWWQRRRMQWVHFNERMAPAEGSHGIVAINQFFWNSRQVWLVFTRPQSSMRPSLSVLKPKFWPSWSCDDWCYGDNFRICWLYENGIRDACSTANIIDCHRLLQTAFCYSSTSGLVVNWKWYSSGLAVV